MSRSSPRRGLFEALPARVLRSIDHARIAPLVDAEYRARILAVMDQLRVPIQTVCYECRLSDGDPRVDIAVCLPAMRTVRADDVLGRLGRRHRGDATWRRCLELLADWSAPASSLVPHIPFVCVAFDLPRDREAVGAPGLSLCVDRDFFARQLGLPVSEVPASEIVGLAGACHDRLHGTALPADCRAMLARCLSGGDGVIARHFSFMVSRAPATFKLDVRLPIDSVGSMLQRIGWPGDVAGIVAGIRELMPWPGHLQLNLVLHPALGSSLEVELLTGRGEAGAGDRAALLRRLVAAGHCAPAKADALLDAWERPVSRGGGLIVARSWYVKARFEGSRIAEAKAYLGLMPRVWYSRRGRQGAAARPAAQGMQAS